MHNIYIAKYTLGEDYYDNHALLGIGIGATTTEEAFQRLSEVLKIGYTTQHIEKRLEQIRKKWDFKSFKLIYIGDCDCKLERIIPHPKGVPFELKKCVGETTLQTYSQEFKLFNEFYHPGLIAFALQAVNNLPTDDSFRTAIESIYGVKSSPR